MVLPTQHRPVVSGLPLRPIGRPVSYDKAVLYATENALPTVFEVRTFFGKQNDVQIAPRSEGIDARPSGELASARIGTFALVHNNCGGAWRTNAVEEVGGKGVSGDHVWHLLHSGAQRSLHHSRVPSAPERVSDSAPRRGSPVGLFSFLTFRGGREQTERTWCSPWQPSHAHSVSLVQL